MIEYRIIDLAELSKHIDAITQEHWDSVRNPLEANLKLDLHVIGQYEALNQLFVVGAFNGDELAGYAAGSVSPCVFSKETIVAHVYALFVKHGFNDNRHIGMKLIKFLQNALSELHHINIFMIHTNGDERLVKVLKRQGFVLSDIAVAKRIHE